MKNKILITGADSMLGQHLINIIKEKFPLILCSRTKKNQNTESIEWRTFDNFQIGIFKIKFRKAKVTPNKIGQFVTLWRRNAEKQTEPFHINDDVNFYMIATRNNERFGFFFFPKHVMRLHQVLTDNIKIGKRGFRVYPDWDIPINKQAQTATAWQTRYFIDLTDDKNTAVKKLNALFK